MSVAEGTKTLAGGLLGSIQPKEMEMGDLLKGGILWLLGVPVILLVILFATGIL